MNDRPRQNPAYRLTRYAPRQGGFPPCIMTKSAALLDRLVMKKIWKCVFDIILKTKPCNSG